MLVQCRLLACFGNRSRSRSDRKGNVVGKIGKLTNCERTYSMELFIIGEVMLVLIVILAFVDAVISGGSAVVREMKDMSLYDVTELSRVTEFS